MEQNPVRHILFPLLAALIWGTAFAAQSVCARYLPPFTVNALRSAIAVAALLPASLAFDGAKRRRRNAERTNRPMLLRGSLVCGGLLAFGVNLQQAGLADTAAGKAGFITAFYVVLVPVFGVFLRKKTLPRIWASVALVSVGLWLLCIRPEERVVLERSDGFLMICAVFYALQVLAVDRYARYVDGLKLSIGQFVVTGLVSAFLALLFERGGWSAEGLRACALPLLYVGAVSSGVGYTLQILAQRGGNPTLVSLLFSMESVFSVLAGAALLGDRLSGREYLGCAVMSAAVILAQIPEKSKKSGKSVAIY